MQIEEGKYYRTAAGNKVGPMMRWATGVPHCWRSAAKGGRAFFSPDGDIWKSDGTSGYAGVPTLVAEWRDAKPGDRIRMLRDDYAGGYSAGDVFTVVSDSLSAIFVDNDGDPRDVDAHPHEIVAERPLQVGDRVRAISDLPKGKTGTMMRRDAGVCFLVKFDNWNDGHGADNDEWYMLPNELERIDGTAGGASASAAPLRVQAGKHYRTQSGAVVGPMMDFGDGRFIKEFGDGNIWCADGKRYCGTLGDIVAEVGAPEQEAEPAAAPAQFKVGDRVRFTDKCPRTWWFGPHSEYKEGVITADYGGGVYDVEVPGTSTPAFSIADDQIEPAPSGAPHAIVAFIDHGYPRPSSTPRVHPDRATAAKEAERLARVYPGKEYGVYELAETRSTAAPIHEWQRLAAAGRRNDAVSELMRVAGVAAPSAFSAVDRFHNQAA